jgi:hypothetical protein
VFVKRLVQMAPAWVGSPGNIMMCCCWCSGAAFLPEFLWEDTTTAGHNLNNILRSASVATCMQIVVRNVTLRHSASRVMMTAAQEAEQILPTAAAGAKASHNTTQIPEEEEGAEGGGTALTVPFEDGTTTPGDVHLATWISHSPQSLHRVLMYKRAQGWVSAHMASWGSPPCMLFRVHCHPGMM